MNVSIYISLVSFRELCSPHLQFQAEQHREKDKTEAEEADGQADQPSEQRSFPGWIIELFTACYGTAALHSLHRGRDRRSPKISLILENDSTITKSVIVSQ